MVNDPQFEHYPQLQQSLREQLEHIQQRMSRELNRARLAGDALPGAQFDGDAELPALMSTLGMIHGDHLHLALNASPGLQMPWDREDMLELLGNLLDNACKWADSQVQLSVQQNPNGFVIEVQDDGPGIPESERDQVFSRGARLDEHVSGHGLGLGIVRDIVEAWGGEMRLETGPLGGLSVIIELHKRKR